MKQAHSRFVLWFVTGCLLGTPFIVTTLWWPVILGLVLFIYCVEHAHSERERFLGGLGVGTLQAMSALMPIWHLYPLEAFGFGPSVGQIILLGGFWILFAISIGIGMALLSYVWQLFPKNIYYFALFPFGVVLSEIVGSLGYALFTLGPGNGVNLYFSFGYSGLPLADSHWFLTFARWGGVYALSFVAGGVSVLVYLTLMRRRWGLLMLLGAVLGGLFIFWFQSNPATKPVEETVVAIETYFDTAFFNQPNAEKIKAAILREAVEVALRESANTILLPEDSRFVDGFSSPDFALEWITLQRENAPVKLIDSARVELVDDSVILRAYVFDTARESIYITDKQYLAPFGEYIPFIHRPILAVIGRLTGYQMFGGSEYVSGPQKTYEILETGSPAILFCMESVSTVGVRNALNTNEAPYVVHPTSHSWFNKHNLLRPNLDRMLRVQAVWSQVPIISAGNMNESKLYHPSGLVEMVEPVATSEYWSLKRFNF